MHSKPAIRGSDAIWPPALSKFFKTGLYDGVQLDNVSTEFPFYERLVGNWISSVPVNLTPEDWVADEVGMLREIRSQTDAAGYADKTIIFNHMRSGEPEESSSYRRDYSVL